MSMTFGASAKTEIISKQLPNDNVGKNRQVFKIRSFYQNVKFI